MSPAYRKNCVSCGSSYGTSSEVIGSGTLKSDDCHSNFSSASSQQTYETADEAVLQNQVPHSVCLFLSSKPRLQHAPVTRSI